MNRNQILRVGLALLAWPAVVLGVWAAFAPRGFYDDFPGFGRMWVAVDGPYNEHLVRDFGAMNLALAFVTIVALVGLHRHAINAALGGWLVFGVPHLVYHLRHLDVFDRGDKVAVGLSVAIAPALAAVLLVRRRRRALDRQSEPMAASLTPIR